MQPLDLPVTSVPHFIPNQVLTDTQLNAVVDYLEQQERFTRQRLIGIGIVCGFETNLVVNGAARAVEISKGVGITSCGFLMNIPQDIVCDRWRIFHMKDYDTFNTPLGDPYDCIELIEDDAVIPDDEIDDVEDLTAAEVLNKIVVLYLDIIDKPNGTCLGENCDEKGNSWVFKLRKLLIPVADMDKVIKYAHGFQPADTLLDMQEFFFPTYFLPQAFVERFGASDIVADITDDFTLTGISSLADFENEYKAIIRPGALRTAKAIAEAYKYFGPLFNKQSDTASTVFNNFSNAIGTNGLIAKIDDYLNTAGGNYKIGNTQYIYDYVRDLADTYNELRQELFALLAECSPPNDVFPRHLMLGRLESRVIGRFMAEDYDIPTIYRHYFIPSPAMNEQSTHYKKTLLLMRRLLLMCDTANYLDFSSLLTGDLEEEPIKLVPGKTCAEPLGKRNIPFYYNPATTPLIYRYWDYDAAVQNMPYLNRGYYSDNWQYSTQPAFHPNIDRIGLLKDYPVIFDICKYPKLGIEGHVGKTVGTAIEELKQLRKKYNLSFDILALKLNNESNVVALAEDKFIAEIQLQYLTERNDYICCVEELIEFIEDRRQVISLGILFMLLSLGVTMQHILMLAPYIQIIIDGYVQALKTLVSSMPPDIKEFDFATMYQIYPIVKSLTNLAKYIINTWGDVESMFLSDKNSGGGKAAMADLASVFLNLWESYLDKLGDDCVLGKFATIYKTYVERMKTFCIFSQFNDQIQGMEHIAGTNNGGTFILVYEDFDPKKEQEFTIKETGGKAVAGAEVWGKETGYMYGYTNNRGRWSGSVSENDETLLFSKSGYVGGERKVKARSTISNMDSYDYYVKRDKWTGEYSEDPVDSIYLKIAGAMNVMKNVGSEYSDMVGRFIGHFTPGKEKVADVTVDNNWDGFRVVADFYLPFPVHHHNIEIEPFDACKRFSDPTFFNYDAVVDYLSNAFNKGFNNLKKEEVDE